MPSKGLMSSVRFQRKIAVKLELVCRGVLTEPRTKEASRGQGISQRDRLQLRIRNHLDVFAFQPHCLKGCIVWDESTHSTLYEIALSTVSCHYCIVGYRLRAASFYHRT